MKITAIGIERMRLPLDPPFMAAWDPVPRRHFDATLVRVDTDKGITGYGSGDAMAGFADYAELFIGRDPPRIATHVRVLEGTAFHARRDFFLAEPLKIDADGCLSVPRAPGLGAVIDEATVARPRRD